MHVGYDDPGWILMQQQCYTSLKFFLTHAKNQDVMAVICSLFARHSTIWMTQLEPEIIFFVKSVERPTYALLDFLIQFLSLTSNSNEWLPQICTSWLPYLASQLQYEDTQGTLAIFQVLILSIHHGMVLSEPNWINLLIPFLPKYPDHVSYLLLPLCHGADKASIVQGIFSNAHVRITSSILTLLCSTQTSLQHPKIHAYLSANLTDIPISIYKSLIQTSKDLTYWIDSIDLLNKLLLTCLSKPTDKIIEALIYLATFSSGRLYFSQKKVAGQILKFIDKKLNKCRDSKVYLEIIKGFSRYFDLHSSILCMIF
ncbi:hypothetical protein HMI56_005040 [Coelomomyces lativittatus]|nr:hypothetical protein HMI56_005040 [Coelomomyces lativittatus]